MQQRNERLFITRIGVHFGQNTHLFLARPLRTVKTDCGCHIAKYSHKTFYITWDIHQR